MGYDGLHLNSALHKLNPLYTSQQLHVSINVGIVKPQTEILPYYINNTII